MKTASTPIEIWMNEPLLRSHLTRIKAIKEVDGVLVIPQYKCMIEKDGKKEVRMYPFWHQKLQFMLDNMRGDYHLALEKMTGGRVFSCGKNTEITVSLY